MTGIIKFKIALFVVWAGIMVCVFEAIARGL
jgi:hypothetical protein